MTDLRKLVTQLARMFFNKTTHIKLFSYCFSIFLHFLSLFSLPIIALHSSLLFIKLHELLHLAAIPNNFCISCLAVALNVLLSLIHFISLPCVGICRHPLLTRFLLLRFVLPILCTLPVFRIALNIYWCLIIVAYISVNANDITRFRSCCFKQTQIDITFRFDSKTSVLR